MIPLSHRIIFLSLLATTGVANADSRIRNVTYAPDQVVRIAGKTGIQSTIQFSSDERIENVAVGDSSAWQITPNRRATLLFVKPLSNRTRTNMTVVTDKRTYMFDLVAGGKSNSALYALSFTYPDSVRTAESPAATVQAPPPPPPPTARAIMTAEKLHFDWRTKGSDKLLPSRVFDDGDALYLAWDAKRPLPAILTQGEDRKEGPLSYRMSGEYIILSPIPANVILRYGRQTAGLWPTRWIPQPQTVTTNGKAIADRGVISAQVAPSTQGDSSTTGGPAVATNGQAQNVTESTSRVKVADIANLLQDNTTGNNNVR